MKNSFYLLLCAAGLLLSSCSKDGATADPAGGQSFSGGAGGSTLNSTSGTGGTNVVVGTGQGGSLARFTIAQNHLYAVDNAQLYAYSLSDPKNPTRTSVTNVGMNVETIYPYKDKLFIGSQQAMFIYSIANPGNPVLEGQANHVRACDPVVANDSMAYVTVRTGTGCGGNTNALLTYNIRNLSNPVQVNSYTQVSNPSGLGLGANKRLYVCNGASGLKVFSLNNPNSPSLIKTVTGYTFNDVIALDDLLVCFTSDGTALFTLGANDDIQFAAKIQD